MASNPSSVLSLIRTIRDDRSVYNSWTEPGFQALLVHRVGVRRSELPLPLRLPVGLLYSIARLVVRNVYNIELSSTPQIGRRLKITMGGVGISPSAVIGDDCVIRQGAIIGTVGSSSVAPRLGDRVDIGAGAVLIGAITVGDDVRIGPNAVVMSSLADGVLAVAAPARVIRPPSRSEP